MPMPNRTRTLDAGQRTSSRTSTSCPLTHLGAARSRLLFESRRSSQRPDLSRLAAGQTSYHLMELRRGPGAIADILARNTSSNSDRGLAGAVGSHAWLAACVRQIVTALGQQGSGPMLQLVFSSHGSGGGGGAMQHRFQTVPVSQSLADNPARWSEFAEHVRGSGANGLVLVRPIASPDQHCAYAAAAAAAAASLSSAASSPCSSCSSLDDEDDYASGPCRAGCGPAASRAADRGIAISGQVGICCDSGSQTETGTDATDPPVSSATFQLQQPKQEQQQQGQQEPQPRSATAGALSVAVPLGRGEDASFSGSRPSLMRAEGNTQYYGLVVQGSCSSEADGCWVLKTTRSDVGGVRGLCSCTHFTLTRVCLGQPLYSQLRDAWLVR